MFVLNPRLAADIFDDEYIIANLDSGLYYSIQGIAVSLVRAMPFEDPSEPIKMLADTFPERSAEIEIALNITWKQLQEEGIVKQAVSSIQANSQWVPTIIYMPPQFNRYADMQDLLMLDPIHDVDEEGWPVRQEQQSNLNEN